MTPTVASAGSYSVAPNNWMHRAINIKKPSFTGAVHATDCRRNPSETGMSLDK
jgi:hypothetical protein